MTGSGSQYAALARRAIFGFLREPAQLFPAFVFPLLFLSLISAALQRSTALPGFPPVDSFAQFAVSASVVQGVLFGAVFAGAAMAGDVEGGFFERLVAAPVSRNAIILGRVAGAAVLGSFQACFFLGALALFGTTPEGGLLAVLLVAITAGLLAAGIGAFVCSLGLRTGSSEAVQGMFPLVFAGVFLSSAFFPREFMHGWFHTAATLNPLSHLIEGIRVQVISGIDLERWLISVAIAGAILVAGTATAKVALEGRLKVARGLR